MSVTVISLWPIGRVATVDGKGAVHELECFMTVI